MSETERLVRLKLLGQNFAFYTGASEEEMNLILALVRKQIADNGGEAGGTIPVSKVAVMACLNLASRQVRLRQEFDEYRQNTEARLRVLNDKLERLLLSGKRDEA